MYLRGFCGLCSGAHFWKTETSLEFTGRGEKGLDALPVQLYFEFCIPDPHFCLLLILFRIPKQVFQCITSDLTGRFSENKEDVDFCDSRLDTFEKLFLDALVSEDKGEERKAITGTSALGQTDLF